MMYLIYRTTNTVNGKIYIGKHQTSNLEDTYLGSGIALKRAIVKYGRESFARDILHVCESESHMNDLERAIVNEDFVARSDTYNMCIGGEGGPIFKGRSHSDLTRSKLSELAKRRVITDDRRRKISESNTGRSVSAETRKKISDKAKDRLSNGISPETRKKMSDARKQRYVGDAGDGIKQRISDSMMGKNKGKSPHKGKTFENRRGEHHPSFKGWYVTPVGTFATRSEAAKANGCDSRTPDKRCKCETAKYPGWSFISVG